VLDIDTLLEGPVTVKLREGTYEAGKSHIVYYQDADTFKDAAHLSAVLSAAAPTGSPNLENDMVLAFLETMQQGNSLNNEQLAKLLELLDEYRDEIAAYRADPDTSQDLTAVPDGNSARIIR
jgi:hypothetical protein